MSSLRELYNPEAGRMQVAGAMSGTGSNLVKIIEHEKEIEKKEGRAPYHVAVIFSENPKSNAEKIGDEHKIPVIVRDIDYFYKQKGKSRNDLSIREEFDGVTAEALKPFNIDVIAYAGYMSIATAPLINNFLGVNVHPADLSIIDGNKRKYTGSHAIRDAILAGEKQLRATTHILEERVDYGRILMISAPLLVNLPDYFNPKDKELVKKVSDEHQNKLKVIGDWVIFPKTLEYLADGNYSQDESKNLFYGNHFYNEPIPNGLKLGG